jgi:hypothetical protein
MSTSTTRFPRRVFADGAEPDPRFTLANERTFLAWIRTALALIAAASPSALDLPIQPTLRLTASIILLDLGSRSVPPSSPGDGSKVHCGTTDRCGSRSPCPVVGVAAVAATDHHRCGAAMTARLFDPVCSPNVPISPGGGAPSPSSSAR